MHRANNNDPDGRAQGLSSIDLPGVGPITLKDVVEALPEEMVGARFAERLGPITGVLVKLLSPAGQVPLHAHPTRDWARQHLGSPFGKTEAWILLDTPGDGAEPAYAGIGFAPGIDRDWFADAVRRHDNAAIRGSLHRTDVQPGEVYVAHAGVPHYLGPRISFIEVQEPSDHIVIPETSGDDDAGATMGLGWDLALDMIDYAGTAPGRPSAGPGRSRACCAPAMAHARSGCSTTTCSRSSTPPRWRSPTRSRSATGVSRSRSWCPATGSIEGDFGGQPVRRGETFALPASLPFRVRARREPVRVVRCLGPAVD